MHEDLALLSQVVDAGGFNRVSMRSGIPKSRISRRIQALEKRLGVQLIDRSSRHFTPTPLGLALARRGTSIRIEAENALRLVQESLSQPSGVLRVASPHALTEQVISEFCVAFAFRNPQVLITLDTTSGTTPSNMDTYDLALVASRQEFPETDMIARRLVQYDYALVATEDWLRSMPPIAEPNDLFDLPAISWLDESSTALWSLISDDGAMAEATVRTRMTTNNLKVSRVAALRGLAMTRLPLTLCQEDIEAGRLRHVLPGWHPPAMSIYALYRTRRSLQLAGKVFIKELAAHLQNNHAESGVQA